MSGNSTNTARHDPYLALRFRDFRLYFLASTLTIIAGGLESTALAWELYERTLDPLVLGYSQLAAFLPVLVFFLPSGHLADRFDRKHIALISRFIEAAAAAGLVMLSLSAGGIPVYYVLIFLAGGVRMFFGAASGAILPKIVPEHAFTNAVTWQMTAFQLASMVGPALGGALIALASHLDFKLGASINAGATLCYALAMVLIMIALVCLYLLRLPRHAPRREAASLADVFEGVRFVFRERLVLSAITLDLFAVLFGGAVALMPIFARDVLVVGPIGFGALRIAPSIGASIMALALTRLPPIRNAGRTLLAVVTGFGLATILFGLSRNFFLSLIALGLTGAFDNVSMVIRGALVPLRTPDAMRGRVGAVERVFISSSNELGGFESGLTASWWGAAPAVVVGGIGTLIVVSLVALGFPQLRALGRLDEIKPAAR